MKHLILILLTLMSLNSVAQIKQDSAGNFYQQKKQDTMIATRTTCTFTDTKGNKYPVYKSQNDKLFIFRVSGKSGKTYKQYLKIDK